MCASMVMEVRTLGYSMRQLPPNPTNALPGTEEKIEVMRKRAEAEHYIFHPEDARRDDKQPWIIEWLNSMTKDEEDEEDEEDE